MIGYCELLDSGAAVDLHLIGLLVIGMHVEAYFMDMDVVLFKGREGQRGLELLGQAIFVLYVLVE